MAGPQPPRLQQTMGISGRNEMQQKLVMTPRLRAEVNEHEMRKQTLLPRRSRRPRKQE